MGLYIEPPSHRPPFKGTHTFHILLIFPDTEQPWANQARSMVNKPERYTRGTLVSGFGRVMGVLNRNHIMGTAVDPTVRILVVLPDSWTFVTPEDITTAAATASRTTESNASTPGTAAVDKANWNPFSPKGKRRMPTTPLAQTAAQPATPYPSRKDTTPDPFDIIEASLLVESPLTHKTPHEVLGLPPPNLDTRTIASSVDPLNDDSLTISPTVTSLSPTPMPTPAPEEPRQQSPDELEDKGDDSEILYHSPAKRRRVDGHTGPQTRRGKQTT